MYQLIISEKPSAAAKIAAALGRAEKKTAGKASYYEVNKGDKKIVVVPAVGHLLTLAEKERTWKYPIFDLEWKPTYETERAAFARPYYENIQKLAKKADSFVVACDYDAEGEVIGLNIIHFLCGQKDAGRMKFSTLTAEDLREAYDNLSPTLDWGQAEAGETRHWLDWWWGVNLSKAVTDALYLQTHRFQILSIGRVQGPALAILAAREIEIQKFTPVPYWQISILLTFAGKKFEALHKEEKFWDESKAKLIFEKIKDKPVTTTAIDTSRQKVNPPVPFDLTSLQIEAYRIFKVSPKQTLEIAQELYTAAYISYPRTSSQKLPPQLNYRKLLTNLAAQPEYSKLAQEILAKKALKPNEGKKTDPAHPAIFPTGEIPKSLAAQQKKIYDLIVKRFLSVFAEPGLRETTTVLFDVEKELFVLKGTITVEQGWQKFYAPYVRKEEVELPGMKKGQVFAQKSKLAEKKTEPPKRYTQASIVKELEKRSLGTKCLAKGEPIHIIVNGNHVSMPIETFVKNFGNAKYFSKSLKGINIYSNSIYAVSKRRCKKSELREILTNTSAIRLTEEHPVYVWENNKIIEKRVNALKKGDALISYRLIRNDDTSRLLGHLIGDASFSLRADIKTPTPDIRYYNSSKLLRDGFVSLIERLYGITCKDYKSPLKSAGFVRIPLRIGREIFGKYPEIQRKIVFNEHVKDPASFVAALFDDEGCVHLRKPGLTNIGMGHGMPRLKLTMKAKQSAVMFTKALNGLGIKTNRIRRTLASIGGKVFTAYTVWVGQRRNIERFALCVPIAHPQKLQKLLNGLSKYSAISKKSQLFKLISDSQGLSIIELSKTLKISQPLVRNYLKELLADGLIKIRRKTERREAAKTNTTVVRTFPVVSFYDTIYAHLKDIVITRELFGKPVKRIKVEKNYDDWVYDVTMDKDPNFVAGNDRLIIHNSTRAQIIDTLYYRGYTKDAAIQVTPLGLQIVQTFSKYAPEILDEKLTRHFEKDMEKIRARKQKRDAVLAEAKKILIKITNEFKIHISDIGKELLTAVQETRKKAETLMECPNCKVGEIRIITSKATGKHFLACNKYPDCKTTFPLPQKGLIKILDKKCKSCGTPTIQVITKGRRPWEFCPNCAGKKTKL